MDLNLALRIDKHASTREQPNTDNIEMCERSNRIFDMKDCAPGDTSVAKSDKFHLGQCPETTLEIKEMHKVISMLSIHTLIYVIECIGIGDQGRFSYKDSDKSRLSSML
uniref:Uncharacterized protein n=1 Tax=Cucumis melo TaxID=3656 RepID=A0A9I9ECE4_CUCME